MKNLKKILSLVVALVMCLSITTVASAASYDVYPDADEVTYTEAMDVLVALGIIKGDDNGQLNPQATVTREEAAKIITYITIGETAAEALAGTGTFFEDVAANRWSAGYIEYCATVGIIDGVGDTDGDGKHEFAPTEDVTAYAFVKMLLCAVGYGAQDEFIGNSWAINVASKGVEIGAFDDSQATSYAAAATREEAMLYAFNVMTGAMTVNYSDLFSAYYSGSTPMKEIDEDDEYKYTLGYKNFGLYQGEATFDAFGREYYEWEVSGDAISDPYYVDVTLTYTSGVYSSTLYSALGSKYAGYATHIINGEDQENDFLIKKGYTAKGTGGYGVLTQVYADSDTYEVTIVDVYTYLGYVNHADDGVVNVTVYDGSASNNVSGNYSYETESFSAGEYVLVTVADGEIQSMEAASTFTGVIGTMASSYLTIDGTKYYKNATNSITNSDLDYYSTYAFITDSYGYLMGCYLYEEADVNLANYVYVTASEYSENLVGASAAIAVQYLDGTTGILYLDLWKSDGKYYYSNGGVATAAAADDAEDDTSAVNGLSNGFYRIATDEDGYVTLKNVSSSSQYAAGWVGKKISIRSSDRNLCINDTYKLTTVDSGVQPGILWVSSSTELYVIEDDGDVTNLTGYSNMKGYEQSNAATLVLYNGSIVEAIYVFHGSYTDSDEYAYFTGGKYSTSSGDYYTFYQDGETVAYEMSSDSVANIFDAVGLYAIDSASGTITSAASVMDRTARVKVTNVYSSYFVTWDGTSYDYHYYDEDTVVYDATNGGAEASIVAGEYVILAEDLNQTGMVECVYIVSAPSTSGDSNTTTTAVTATLTVTGENKVIVATASASTVYVVVEKFADNGYTEFYAQTVTTTTDDLDLTINNARAFGAGNYRVTVYADSDYTAVLAREYFTVVEAVG